VTTFPLVLAEKKVAIIVMMLVSVLVISNILERGS
jgi:hypothetical protein